MSFSQEELAHHREVIHAYIERRRPPAPLRNQVDLSFSIKNQSIELFQIRSPLGESSFQTVDIAIAKTTWVKSRKVWRIFWQRANLKWYRYDPCPEVKTLEEFINVVDADPYGCFYG